MSWCAMLPQDYCHLHVPNTSKADLQELRVQTLSHRAPQHRASWVPCLRIYDTTTCADVTFWTHHLTQVLPASQWLLCSLSHLGRAELTPAYVPQSEQKLEAPTPHPGSQNPLCEPPISGPVWTEEHGPLAWPRPS